jgi:plasmid stability protein
MDPWPVREVLVPVNLSIKNVPDAVARKLRERAAANGRSLQKELLALLEAATDERREPRPVTPARRSDAPRRTVQQIHEAARARFPNGTPSSVEFIRAQRDAGLSVDLGAWPDTEPPR